MSGSSAHLCAGVEREPLQSLKREVHVWLATPTMTLDSSLVQSYCDVLDDEERAQAEQFRFEHDRQLYIVAHALLRTALSYCCEVSPSEWRFRKNSYGRPEIVGDRAPVDLRFNLSHTQGLVACAVTVGVDVGVDVEQMRPLADLHELAACSFAPDEVRRFSEAPVSEQKTLFFRYWTLKEAYVKARGMGLSLPTREFAFRFGGDHEIGIRFSNSIEDAPSHWQFFVDQPTRAHALAVAIRRADERDRLIRVRWTTPLQCHQSGCVAKSCARHQSDPHCRRRSQALEIR